MAEQDVSDRLATIEHVWGEGSTEQAKADEVNLWESLASEPYMARAVKDIRWLLKQLADYRQIDLEQDAVNTRLSDELVQVKAENERLKADSLCVCGHHLMPHILTAATQEPKTRWDCNYCACEEFRRVEAPST